MKTAIGLGEKARRRKAYRACRARMLRMHVNYLTTIELRIRMREWYPISVTSRTDRGPDR